MPVASLIPRVAFSTGPAQDSYKAATDDPFSPMRSPGIMSAATMLPTPPDEPSKKKKKKADKVRSAWISFIGRILAQVVGAAASVVFGIVILQKYQSSGRESKSAADASPAPHTAAVRARRNPNETAIAVLPLARDLLARASIAKGTLEGVPLSVDGSAGADSQATTALVYLKSGDSSHASAIVAQLNARRPRAAGALARYYAAAGNRDRAVDAIAELAARNPAALQPLKNDPLLDPIRSDPRFAELVQHAAASLPGSKT